MQEDFGPNFGDGQINNNMYDKYLQNNTFDYQESAQGEPKETS